VWPWYKVALVGHTMVTLLSVTNQGDTPMTFTTALHTYFKAWARTHELCPLGCYHIDIHLLVMEVTIDGTKSQ
jgi:hypothetical protein